MTGPRPWRLWLFCRGAWAPDRAFTKRAAVVRAGKRIVRGKGSPFANAYKVEVER